MPKGRNITKISPSFRLWSHRRFKIFAPPSMANNHPKNEAYLSAIIPKRIKLFEEFQAKQLEQLQSLPHDPIKVTIRDGNNVKEVKQGKRWETTPMEIAMQISRGLAKSALISSVKDALWDFGKQITNLVRLYRV